MKKFLDLLAKGKRKQDNFYSFCNASFCDNANDDIPKNRYKYFKFDSDCYCTSEAEYEISFDARAGDLNRLSWTEMFDLQLTNDFGIVESECMKSDSVASFHKTVSRSESEQSEFQTRDKKKSRKTMYVINIRNSKCFHIGSKETINISEKEPLQPGIDDIFQLKFKINELLDCEEKLSEECITLISLHLGNQWKEFVEYLGLEENFLKELELRNDNNTILIVYDALQKFINKFPNTSFGFVFNILSQIHQVDIIEKLMKEFSI